MPHTVNLDAFVAEQVEKDELIISAGDREFRVPPPMLWPEGVLDKPADQWGKEVLGDEWDAFVERGGTSGLFAHLVLRRAELSDEGESDAS